ncbi:MAG: MATE family efflux transporter [Steroidobacter sp.]
MNYIPSMTDKISFGGELKATWLLALPMILGQIGQMLIGITDAAFIGRIGTVELAAAAFTNGVYGLSYVVGLGLLSPVGILTARDHGADDQPGCAAWLIHGRLLALSYALLALVFLGFALLSIRHFSLPDDVVAAIPAFFILHCLSLIPATQFQAQRQYLDAMGQPWVGSVIIYVNVAFNALLNWVFIWGHWGSPALGLAGSGVATLIARSVSVVLISLWLRREKRESVPWQSARMRELVQLGVPSASSLFFESGIIIAAMIMLGWLGAVPLAAHQIALTCASFSFMFPLGIAMATGIRISRARGEMMNQQPNHRLRVIGLGAIAGGGLIMILFALSFALAGKHIAAAFTPEIAVIDVTAQLLFVAAFFQLFDGIQVIALGALRGLTDVRVPTLITFFAYWLIGLPSAYLLGFKFHIGATGVWSGLAIGLGLAAILLLWRFFALTPKPIEQHQVN